MQALFGPASTSLEQEGLGAMVRRAWTASEETRSSGSDK